MPRGREAAPALGLVESLLGRSTEPAKTVVPVSSLCEMSMAKWLGIVPDRERVVVVLVLLLFLCLATVYSLATPIFEGYDEKWHYAYVQHIASGRGLPRQPPDQYGDSGD